jgi:predicted lipid-binding transport protein (Tim44 family)
MTRPLISNQRTLCLAAAVLMTVTPAAAQPPAPPSDAPPARTWKIVGGSLLGGGLAAGTAGGVLFFRDTKMEPAQLWLRLALFAGGVGAAFTGGWMLAFPPSETAAPQGALVVRTLRF